jgi:ApaG protein
MNQRSHVPARRRGPLLTGVFAVMGSLVSPAQAASSCEPSVCAAGVTVGVVPTFMDDESSPAANRFMWSYAVRVENRLPVSVRLLGRRWKVADATGRVETVEGDGVVGLQPTLSPGESFRYASWFSLMTSAGRVEGELRAVTGDGVQFWIKVQPFTLAMP